MMVFCTQAQSEPHPKEGSHVRAAEERQGSKQDRLSSEQQDEIRRAAKRRQKSKMNLHTGQDILTAAREDRLQAAREAAAARSLRSQFTTRMNNIIEGDACKLNWSVPVRTLCYEYIESLVTGNATIPEGLRCKPVTIMQFKFALTCVHLDIPDGTLPGQSADWYEKCLQDAQRYYRNSRKLACAS
jgi:hypothetical protein